MRVLRSLQISFAVSCSVLVMGCDGSKPQSGSRVAINIPTIQQMESMRTNIKYQTLSGLIVDYNLLCFYVNVTSTDIPTNNTACMPPRGVFGGGVGPGGNIEIDVPNGVNRKIELFGYLRGNASSACPSFDAAKKPNADLIYSLGTAPGITVAPPSVKVPIEISLPSIDQNLRTVYGWNQCPMTGTVSLTNSGKGRVQAGILIASGSLTNPSVPSSSVAYKLSSQVSFKQEGLVHESANQKYKLNSWMKKSGGL